MLYEVKTNTVFGTQTVKTSAISEGEKSRILTEEEKQNALISEPNVRTIVDYAPEDYVLELTPLSYDSETDTVTVTEDIEIDITGKVLCANGCSGLILSYDTNTITFDRDIEEFILEAIEAGNSIEVVEPLIILDEDLPIVIAADTRVAKGAIILPNSTEYNERQYLTIYSEFDGLGCSVITPDPTEYIGTSTYTCVKYKQESIVISPHLYGVPHWDILSTYNYAALAGAYMTANSENLGSEFAEFSTEANTSSDFINKFRITRPDGNSHFKYLGPIKKYFIVNATANVIKTGGQVGEAYLVVRKNETTVDTRIANTRFGSGDGKQVVSVAVPVELSYGDIITILAKKTGASDYVIAEGSNITIHEI